MQTDSWTGMTKLTFAFSEFCESACENVCKYTSSFLGKFNFIDPVEEDCWTWHVGSSSERRRNAYKIVVRVLERKERLEDLG